MRLIALIPLTILLASCGQTKRIQIEGSGQQVLLLTGIQNSASIKKQAHQLGLKTSGDAILRIEGDIDSLNQLEVDENVIYSSDVGIEHESVKGFKPIDGSQYLAKKDFGILEFWQQRPLADGRGVVVGVFDDGISAHQSGFQVTTTGERKFLKRGSQSTLTSYTLEKNGDVWNGEIIEDQDLKKIDLNGNKTYEKFNARVSDKKICLDLNLDQDFSSDECKGAFSETGEFFMLPNTAMSIVAEFDEETSVLKLSQPEEAGDSHGEGVASVMAAYNQGGIQGMSGVAPGAQIVDFDISELAIDAKENDYTMGTILQGLEWLAKNGAEVINISYSLFFSSVKSQDFMSKAIDELVKKYNVVLTFSAGNNGPGLGSLNRKVIYPDSVLVTGAFVSKELDARVWGVSGLPEEGRVVYYSSRGPGPLGDHGPTLISPLSSLTHSSPDEGFRAFSGTSSAAPALAGAATVLISALKQDNIKVDARTVVQALRLAGKRLSAEPFVAQGYGLPQVDQALKIYQRLIAGKQFMNVQITTNRGAQDSIAGRGILMLRSQVGTSESVRIDLKGVISPIAPVTTATDLLTPIKIEYPKGVTGTNELWVSNSSSRFNVEIDTNALLEGTNGEAFGEIRLKDSRSDELLAIVPVTILGDRHSERPMRTQLKVGSQGSARFHINATHATKALRLRTRVLSGDPSGLILSIFDANRVRKQQIRLTDDLLIEISSPGHHQIALAMSGGTGKEAVVEFDVEPVRLELKTRTAKSKTTSLNFANQSSSSVYGIIELIKPAPILARAVSEESQGEVKPLELTVTLKEKVSVSAKMIPLDSADTSYLYSNCSGIVTDAEGKKTIIEANYDSTDDKEKTIVFRCMPFDHGITGFHEQSWEMQIVKEVMPTKTENVAFSPGQQKKIFFSGVEADHYEVWFKLPLGGNSFKIGEVDLVD